MLWCIARKSLARVATARLDQRACGGPRMRSRTGAAGPGDKELHNGDAAAKGTMPTRGEPAWPNTRADSGHTCPSGHLLLAASAAPSPGFHRPPLRRRAGCSPPSTTSCINPTTWPKGRRAPSRRRQWKAADARGMASVLPQTSGATPISDAARSTGSTTPALAAYPTPLPARSTSSGHWPLPILSPAPFG